MKLISLNTWGGRSFNSLIEFIKQHSQDTDIFCFQEIQNTTSDIKEFHNLRVNLLWEIKQVLPHFHDFYFPVMKGFDDEAEAVNFNLTFGQAMFVNKNIKVTSEENYIIFQEENFKKLKKDFSNLPTPLQYLGFKINNKEFAVFNFHGTSFPGSKFDTDRRLSETKKVKEIMESKKGAKILVGDFNLLPDTQSIQAYEKNLRNLIEEFNIQRTRSKSSPYYGKEDFQKFADYTFVSKDVEVISFEVPKVEISDHLPMILEFS